MYNTKASKYSLQGQALASANRMQLWPAYNRYRTKLKRKCKLAGLKPVKPLSFDMYAKLCKKGESPTQPGLKI